MPDLPLETLHFNALQSALPCIFHLRLAESDISADICTRTAAAEPGRELSLHLLWHASAAHSIANISGMTDTFCLVLTCRATDGPHWAVYARVKAYIVPQI